MNILVATHAFPPRTGGIERHVALLAGGLAERFRIVVVTATPAAPGSDEGLPYQVVRRPSPTRLYGLVRDASVVHCVGPTLAAMALAAWARRPFVVSHHGYQAICPNGLLLQQPLQSMCPGHYMAGRRGDCRSCRSADLGRLGAWRSLALMLPRRVLLGRAAAQVSVTAHVARRIGAGAERVIPHGVAKAHAAAAAPPRPRVTFGFVGRLVREKGVEVLIEAAARLAEPAPWRLVIVGDGPERARLERRAAEAGVAAEFTGALLGAALEEVRAGFDVEVMPSVWEEPAGLSAMEAMSRGTALIASDTGGLAETVAEAGLLVRPGDVASLAGAMRRLLANEAERRQLGEAGRRRAVERHSLAAMFDAYERLWRSLA